MRTECKATFVVAAFHNSSAKFFKPARYSYFSELSDSRLNIPVYLSGLCMMTMSITHEKIKKSKTSKFYSKTDRFGRDLKTFVALVSK